MCLGKTKGLLMLLSLANQNTSYGSITSSVRKVQGTCQCALPHNRRWGRRCDAKVGCLEAVWGIVRP